MANPFKSNDPSPQSMMPMTANSGKKGMALTARPKSSLNKGRSKSQFGGRMKNKSTMGKTKY